MSLRSKSGMCFSFFSHYRNILFPVILLAGAGWIWLSAADARNSTLGSTTAPQPGFEAPDFTIETTQGELLRLSGLRGRPVMINFWASWCQPCRLEMPAIQRVYTDYHNEDLAVLGVNVTNLDNSDEAMAFVQEMNLSFPILLDRDGQIAYLYQIRAFPTTYFVDAQGIIQDMVVGGPMSEALLRIRVEQLIGKAQ
jgi:peroxiredoxin